MAKDQSLTPKATITLSKVGPGFTQENVKTAGNATFKIKRGQLSASLAASDATLRNGSKLTDAVATVDFKAAKGFTLNGKYELASKKYQVGATLDTSVAKKPVTLKAYYSTKDNLVSGDASLALNKFNKASITFNQNKLLTAKYTLVQGKTTVEPSYNFGKKSTALAVTQKLSAKDTLKIAYDLKSEGASLEYNHKPFKVVVSSSVSKKLAVGKPSVSASIEQVYEF